MKIRFPRLFMSFPSLSLMVFVSSIAAIGASKEPPTTRDGGLPVLRGLIERYATDLATVQRSSGIPTSASRLERLNRFYDAELKLVEEVKFNDLDQAGKIDYILFRNKLKFEKKDLAHDDAKEKEVSSFVPFAGAIVKLEEARRKMEPIQSEAAAKTIAEIAKSFAEARKAAEKMSEGTVDGAVKIKARRAAGMVMELKRSLAEWHEFYGSYNPEFGWWVNQSWQKLDTDLDEYAKFLRRKVAKISEEGEAPVIGDPVGREALVDALQEAMIPYTPEELIDIANQEFAWCEKEMKRAADDLGFDGNWQKAMDHTAAKHLPPSEQPTLIRDLAREATEYVKANALVSVPPLCEEVWRMEMMPPERQKVNPYFTGGEVISVSYPTATMSYEDKLMSMRGNNAAFCRATVFHEVIPGHHLQGFMAQRYNTHRKLFRAAFLIEGWSLYWEMLLWDMKFPRTAEERVGMLFWRAHRCARIIFSLKFHLGQMTAPEAIDFLVTRVGHERRNATAEVRRSFEGGYDPLYQAAYMVGGLQIRSMHNELVKNGKMSNKAFHDAILRENAIPIEMIRASLTNQKLTPDFVSQWKFYNFEKTK